MFKIKDGYKVELKTPETMEIFGSSKKKENKKTNRKNKKWSKFALKVVEVVIVRCNLVDSQYQQKSEVLYTFTPKKSYGYLLNIEPSNLVFLKTYNTEFVDIIITFTDQNGRLLEREGKVNLKLLIKK